MELNKQVCSLELAKRLKELGVRQESLFHWHEGMVGHTHGGIRHEMKLIFAPEVKIRDVDFSAFTTSELGEMLKQAGPAVTIRAYGDLYGFKGTVAIGSIGLLTLLTEPDRLAEMLIHILYNKELAQKIIPLHSTCPCCNMAVELNSKNEPSERNGISINIAASEGGWGTNYARTDVILFSEEVCDQCFKDIMELSQNLRKLLGLNKDEALLDRISRFFNRK